MTPDQHAESIAALKAENCRQCRDHEPPIQTRAEFILWGKLLPPEAFGPKCYDHAAEHLGWQAMSRIDQYVVYDLRPINALIDGPVCRVCDTDGREFCTLHNDGSACG